MPEVVGQAFMDANRWLVEHVLAGNEHKAEAELQGAGGRHGWFWLHVFPRLEAGAVRGFFVVVTDISESAMRARLGPSLPIVAMTPTPSAKTAMPASRPA